MYTFDLTDFVRKYRAFSFAPRRPKFQENLETIAKLNRKGFSDLRRFMEKIYKNKTVIGKDGRYRIERVELDTIKAVIVELDERQLKNLLEIIQFQQRVSKLFFEDEEKYEAYQSEADKALKEYQKVKGPTKADLVKCERAIVKAMEDNCGVNGRALILEVARRVCQNVRMRDIVSWTFSINDVFEDNMYDWMY